MRTSFGTAQTPAEMAFAFGFLAHAAGDVFAHTYVNMYSGDIYDLTNGELSVETRHFLLEGYISSRLPPISDGNGAPLGLASDLILNRGKLAIPSQFLLRAFLYDARATDEFRRAGSPHIWAVHEQRKGLIQISAIAREIEDLVQKAVIEYYFDVALTDEQLEVVQELDQRIRDINNRGIDYAQEVMGQIFELEKGVVGVQQEAFEDAFESATEAIEDVRKLQGEIAAVELEIAIALDELIGLVDPCTYVSAKNCNFKCPGVIPYPCGKWYKPKLCWAASPSCLALKAACVPLTKLLCTVNPLRPRLENIVKVKQKLQREILEQIDGRVADAAAAVAQANAVLKSALVARRVVLMASIDLWQRLHSSGQPISGFLNAWIDDIDLTIARYFDANGEAIRRSLTGQSPTDPLEEWLSCHFWALLGIPSEVPKAGCAVRDVLVEIDLLLEEIQEVLKHVDPVLSGYLILKERIREEIESVLRAEVNKFVESATGVDVERLLSIIEMPATPAILNEEFSLDVEATKLLTFDRVTQRIDLDMNLSEGFLDPERFAPIRNAVVLAKLSLVDGSGYGELWSAVGAGPSWTPGWNIMFRAASSIDGNHQWMAVPPPYPRKENFVCAERTYGYEDGFAVWKDPGVREGAFRRLFTGPMAPGLETPQDFGLTAALPPNFPYRVSAADPFPDRVVGACGEKPADGDLNGDGMVNFLDLGLFRRCLPRAPGCDDVLHDRADMSDDGVVNTTDLDMFRVLLGR